MNHEAVSLVTRDGGQCGTAGARIAHETLSRPAALAVHRKAESPRVRGADASLAVGATCRAAGDGETIQLTQVTPDFVFWINPTNGSTGRMQRCHFLNFFTPISK